VYVALLAKRWGNPEGKVVSNTARIECNVKEKKGEKFDDIVGDALLTDAKQSEMDGIESGGVELEFLVTLITAPRLTGEKSGVRTSQEIPIGGTGGEIWEYRARAPRLKNIQTGAKKRNPAKVSDVGRCNGMRGCRCARKKIQLWWGRGGLNSRSYPRKWLKKN